MRSVLIATVALVATVGVAEAKCDWRSGNCYYGSGSGYNYRTGSSWYGTNDRYGSRGIDSNGNYYSYNRRSGTYYNSGSGFSNRRSGYYRY